MKRFTLYFLMLLVIFFAGCSGSNDSSDDVSNAAGNSQEEATNPLVVQTEFGKIEGTAEKNSIAWKGIPYAAPPVKELRWKAPRDPQPWNDVKQCKAFQNFCLQYANLQIETTKDDIGKIVGSEDCLYLNIWRPQNTDKNLPVLVFIHGGGNLSGRADLTIYEGANFAAKNNMIFITVGYRIGYFGWFTHPALREGKDKLDDSGNYGTLDQIKALKWIQKNIGNFGGNPGNVTISGQSAGAIDVYALMTSPLANGLFHKAIPMSGFNQCATSKAYERKGDVFLKELLKQDGKPATESLGKGSDWIRNYLRSRTPEQLCSSDIGAKGAKIPTNYIAAPLAIMGVRIDGVVIPMSPLEAFQTGNYNKVPIMIGCTSEEFKIFIMMALVSQEDLFAIMERFDPNNPDPDLKVEDYLDPMIVKLLPVLMPTLTDVGTLFFAGYGQQTMAANAKKWQDDVYAYRFAWKDEPKPFDYYAGAFHTIDVPFAFGNMVEDRKSCMYFAWSDANREKREALSDSMMTYLGNFCKNGNPNGPGLTEWKPWNSEKGELNKLIFDVDKIHMSADFIEPGTIPDQEKAILDFMAVLLGLFI